MEKKETTEINFEKMKENMINTFKLRETLKTIALFDMCGVEPLAINIFGFLDKDIEKEFEEKIRKNAEENIDKVFLTSTFEYAYDSEKNEMFYVYATVPVESKKEYKTLKAARKAAEKVNTVNSIVKLKNVNILQISNVENNPDAIKKAVTEHTTYTKYDEFVSKWQGLMEASGVFETFKEFIMFATEHQIKLRQNKEIVQ